MARKHFDRRGYPKLKMIAGEIIQYLSHLPETYLQQVDQIIKENNYGMNLGPAYLNDEVDSLVYELLRNREKRPSVPVTVNGIFVVGGQAVFLPDSYHTGDHDLDIKIVCDIETSAADELTRNFVIGTLYYKLNGKDGIKRNSKDFLIDVAHACDNDPLKKPFFEIIL